MPERLSDSDCRFLIQHSIEGVLIWDDAGAICYANIAMANILGYQDISQFLDNVTDFTRDCFIDESDRATLLTDFDNGRDHIRKKIRLKHRDGTVIWMHADIYCTRDKTGAVEVFKGFFLEITDQVRKQHLSDILISISNAVSTTHDLNELFHTIHTTLKIAVDTENFYIALIDEEKDRLVFPYFQDEMDSFLDIRNISDPGNKCISLDVIRSGNPLFLTESDLAKRNIIGTAPKVWIGVPLRVRGRVIGLMAVQHYSNPRHYTYQDVDIMISVSEQVGLAVERKINQEILVENEARYRSILDNIVEGYYEVDMCGNFTFFNDSLCRMVGYTRDELMGMNNREIMDEVNAKEVYDIFNEVYRLGIISQGYDWELIRKDGSRCSIGTSVSLIKNKRGEPVGFRGLARDVSERKQAEQEKRDMEKQLQHAQRMESIGTLAGGIAHNFNNLLMAIQGYTTMMLLDADPADKQYRMLQSIEKQVTAGSRLTSQLLGYAREGKYEIKPINLNHLVRETGETFAMTKKEIRVYQQLTDNLDGVIADRGQIEQVLMNLLVNSADAMPQGGDLTLKTENVTDKDIHGDGFVPKPGPYVCLSVRDTGIGMDDDTMEHIFEPFFTTKDISKGSGLGLASAYGIVKAHGGYLQVQSQKAVGTTFFIYLPASPRSDKAEKKMLNEVVKGEGTVLFVDDDEVIRGLGRDLLTALGYNSFIASGGEDAIDLYQQKKDEIDLVVLDMIMPDMSGGAVYDQLRAIDPKVKVLLSSGYSIDGQATEILNRGCNGFIQKPFKLNELSEKIRSILE